MSAPTRDEAVRTLEEGHRAVAALLSNLSDDELARPATIGGGDWSAKDLLGHLTSWEEYALEAWREWEGGERPAIEGAFTDEAVDRLNEEAVARKAEMTVEDLRGRAEEVHAALLAAIEGATDDTWNAEAPYATERRTTFVALLGSVIGAPKRPFGHVFAHLPDLEAYVASLRTNA